MLMLFRVIVSGYDTPRYFNSSEMEKYCKKISDVLNDDAQTVLHFQEVCKIIDDSGVDINNQKRMYQENTRDSFLKSAKKYLDDKKVNA